MNEILNLIGTKYSVEVHYNAILTAYVTNTRDSSTGKGISKSFSGVEAELARHDVLLHTIETSIMSLQAAQQGGEETP